MNIRQNNLRAQTGFSMIEVLVSLIILLVGLLGLAGLMIQSQRSEMESYQRVQALILLKDMVGRINANRNVAANVTNCYAFTTNAAAGTPFVGKGIAAAAVPTCTGTAATTAQQIIQAQNDLQDWNSLLNGTSETSPVSGNAGAIVGARGCVSYNSAPYNPTTNPGGELIDFNGLPLAGTGVYTVEVAWQGMNDTFAPVALNCGKTMYGAETKRRDMSLTFRIASINNTLTP